VYNNEFTHKFEGDLLEKAKMLDIEDAMLSNLSSGDFGAFIKVGMQYADMVLKSNEDFSENMNALFQEYKITKQINSDENILDNYFDLYNELAN